MKFLNLFILIFALGFGNQANAYIPPSFFILKTLASKHSGYKGIRIRSMVTAFENGKPGSSHFKEVAIFDSSSGNIKSRAFDDSGKLLYAVERVISTSAASASEILLSANALQMAEGLKKVGVPVLLESELMRLDGENLRREAEITSLARWRGTFAWVIGPEKSNARKSQLWVEKDSFLPIRKIVQTEDNLTETRFENFRFFRDLPYPRIISLLFADKVEEFSDDKNIYLRAELSELAVNPDLKEMKSQIEPGFTDAGNSVDSSSRELIRRYYEFVR